MQDFSWSFSSKDPPKKPTATAPQWVGSCAPIFHCACCWSPNFRPGFGYLPLDTSHWRRSAKMEKSPGWAHSSQQVPPGHSLSHLRWSLNANWYEISTNQRCWTIVIHYVSDEFPITPMAIWTMGIWCHWSRTQVQLASFSAAYACLCAGCCSWMIQRCPLHPSTPNSK